MQLTKLLADEGVQFMGHLEECMGERVQEAVAQLQDGQVLKAPTNRTVSHLQMDIDLRTGDEGSRTEPFT